MNRPASVIDLARADGFTHVKTLAGPIPLEQWWARDHIALTYADGVIYGPWRPATTAEEVVAEQAWGPVIGVKARDKHHLTTITERRA
jgi:hypothetical protein